MQVTSTHGLVERGRAGDASALAELFERYRGRIEVLVHYKLGAALRQHYEVEDIVQEALLRAHRDFASFEYQSSGSFFRWLSSIVNHVLVDLSRYQNRGRRRAAEVVRFRSESNPGGPEPADSQTPSRVFAGKERADALIARLDALPDDYRQVIVLAKIEGLTTAEIAGRMGRSRESVAVLLHRAVKRYRTLIEP